MNLLFFRRKKAQPISLSAAAATVAGRRSSTAVVKPEGTALATDAATAVSGFLEMPLESLLPFLPESAVRHNHVIESRRSVRLPLNQILPQLSRGHVVTPLSDVLPQLPPEMVTAQMPYTGSEKISLPLEHVVAYLSPEALRPRDDQREIELSDADIPAPFVEDAMAAQWSRNEPPLLVETPAEQTNDGRFADSSRTLDQAGTESEPQSEAFRLPENLDEKPLFEPISMSTRSVEPTAQEPEAPKQASTPASAPSWRGQWVYVTVADIVDAIPDSYLFASRESLQSQVDPARKVPIAIEDVVSQLAKGRIALRLSKLKGMLPEGFLVPDVSDGEAVVGLDKVIDQLPESAFTQDLEQQDAWKEIEAIPTPFHEKTDGAPAVAEENVEEVKDPEVPAQDRVADPRNEQIPTPVEEEKTSELDLLAEANRLEPLFVEKAKEPETVAPLETVAEATVPVVESVPPAEVKAEEAAVLDAQPAPAEAETILEAPVTNQAEIPVAEQQQIVEPKAEEEEDLDSITLAADVSAETQSGVPVVSKEQIAEALHHLNTWSEEELHNNNLGPTLTQRIMEWRQHRGGFKDLRELMQIAGIGPKLFQRVLGFGPEALEDQAHAINRLFSVPEDHEMTLQEIVKCASKLQGVEGCIVAMSDGIYMTGDLPNHLDSQRVSAFAPQLFARVAQYVRELNVGTARRFTIFTDAQPITIFKSGDLFFIVIHKANRFSKVLLNKCERISQEISRLCSKESANR